MTGAELGAAWLTQDKIAWSSRKEAAVNAAFDKLDEIRDQVRAMGVQAMEDFDAVVMPHGFKSVARGIW